MKKVLVTGVNSYVGNSFAEWVSHYPDEYDVDRISVRDDKWKEVDLSVYDSILHVAGIAHVSTDPKMEEKYYKVNRDLTIELAQAAKEAGVKQFIFMSSIIVYGENIENNGVINKNTIPKPTNFYGNSKLEAEQGIELLQNEKFKIVIVRPPMIYGRDSKGNYPKLAKLAKRSPLFPYVENRRSMLHIDNLNEFLKLMIENEEKGLFFPQNKEYVQTSEMVKIIAEVHGQKVHLLRIFNFIFNILRNKSGIVNKVFGDLVYMKDMSEYKKDYCVNSFKESIIMTELEN